MLLPKEGGTIKGSIINCSGRATAKTSDGKPAIILNVRVTLKNVKTINIIPKELDNKWECEFTVTESKEYELIATMSAINPETKENESLSVSRKFRVKIEEIPPVLSVSEYQEIYGPGPKFPAQIILNASDNSGISNVILTYNSVTKNCQKLSGNEWEGYIEFNEDGLHLIKITAIDLHQNITEKNISIAAKYLKSNEWNESPLLLMPLRLETRLIGDNLWVRIYPDEIFFNSHDPELSSDEIIAGKNFLNEPNKKDAWRALAQQYGPERAAWIRRKTLENPNMPASASGKNKTHLANPKLNKLPKKFVAFIYQGEFSTKTFEGKPVRQGLKLLPFDDPVKYVKLTGQPITAFGIKVVDAKGNAIKGVKSLFHTTNKQVPSVKQLITDTNGRISFSDIQTDRKDADLFFEMPALKTTIPVRVRLDRGLVTVVLDSDLINARWMTDLDQAYADGMAIQIPKSKLHSSSSPISRLVVVGIQDGDAGAGAKELEQLLDAHHYSSGLGFVTYGTPTNNTEAGTSGFSKIARDIEKSYSVEVEGTAASQGASYLGAQTNAQRLGTALGWGQTAQALRNLENAGEIEDSLSKFMRTALWPILEKRFLSELLKGVVNQKTVTKIKNLFTEWVSGSGALPTIRVGNQPYGVLPVGDLYDWEPEVDCITVSYQLPNTQGILQGNASLVDNKPIVNASITLIATNKTYSTKTDAKGDFKFPGLSEITDKSVKLVIVLPGQQVGYSIDASLQEGKMTIKVDDTFERNALTILRNLSMVWLNTALSEVVPKIRVSGDPDVEFIDFLRMQPVSSGYNVRPFLPSEFVNELLDALKYYTWKEDVNIADLPDDDDNVLEPPRIMIDEWKTALDQEIIKAKDFWTDTLGNSALENSDLFKQYGWWNTKDITNYLSLEFYPKDGITPRAVLEALLKNETLSDKAKKTLLYQFIYQSLIPNPNTNNFNADVADALERLLYAQVIYTINSIKTADGLNKPTHFFLKKKSPRPKIAPSQQQAVQGILDKRQKLPDQKFTTIGQIKSASGLNERDWESLMESIRGPKSDIDVSIDRFFRETLDLMSHRLDAWISALPAKRLANMRATSPSGIFLGAYGWVEDLKLNDSDEFALSYGYIHAPSRGQAATAAVLHNAFMTHKYDGVIDITREGNPFAINLNSERVRRGLQILDGVRQGQPLGALLGYQFERALHEYGRINGKQSLDRFIDDFRNWYPLDSSAANNKSESGSVETTLPRNVVNGLDLVHAWEKGEHGIKEKLGANEVEWTALSAELSNLQASLDGVSDLLLFESTHHAIQGNFERSGAALEAAAGNGYPPEVESMNTPVSGRSFQHRLCWMFPVINERIYDGIKPGSSRNRITLITYPRTLGEPSVAAWVAKVIGDTNSLFCEYVYGENKENGKVSIKELGLSAADLLYLAAQMSNGRSAELDQRTALLARSKHGLPFNASLTVTYNTSLKDAMYLARQIMKAIGAARPMEPKDLALSSEAEQFHHTPEQAQKLYERVQAVSAQLKDLLPPLLVPFPQTNPKKPQEKVADLQQLGQFGILFTFPGGLDDPNLNLIYSNAIKEARKRVNDCTAHLGEYNDQKKAYETACSASNPPTHFPEGLIGLLVKAMKALLGESFVVLPAFEIPPSNRLIRSAFQQQSLMAGLTEESLVEWMQQAAPVHAALGNLDDLWLLMESGPERKNKLNLHVSQLPYRPENRWLGLSDAERGAGFEIHTSPKGEALSIVTAYGGDQADFDKMWQNANQSIIACGLVIDQWNEFIPNKTVQTGLSFHYNAPNTQPPQSLLLAVPAKRGTSWSDLGEVADTVSKTLDLAKVRAVDMEALNNSTNITRSTFPALQLNEISNANTSGIVKDFLNMLLGFSHFNLLGTITQIGPVADYYLEKIWSNSQGKGGVKVFNRIAAKDGGFFWHVAQGKNINNPKEIFRMLTFSNLDPIFEFIQSTKSVEMLIGIIGDQNLGYPISDIKKENFQAWGIDTSFNVIALTIEYEKLECTFQLDDYINNPGRLHYMYRVAINSKVQLKTVHFKLVGDYHFFSGMFYLSYCEIPIGVNSYNIYDMANFIQKDLKMNYNTAGTSEIERSSLFANTNSEKNIEISVKNNENWHFIEGLIHDLPGSNLLSYDLRTWLFYIREEGFDIILPNPSCEVTLLLTWVLNSKYEEGFTINGQNIINYGNFKILAYDEKKSVINQGDLKFTKNQHKDRVSFYYFSKSGGHGNFVNHPLILLKINSQKAMSKIELSIEGIERAMLLKIGYK